jgi:peptide/nickel transport system substrate-binding protein
MFKLITSACGLVLAAVAACAAGSASAGALVDPAMLQPVPPNTVMRRAIRLVTLAATATVLSALALQAAEARPIAGGPAPGGVYRVAFESAFPFTDNLDPTGEYYSVGEGILSNLLVRTLVGYNHVAGPAGNKLVPDLATSVPAPTDGGRTYTFHLKPGVRFGPPVDREVTSADVLYALERIGHPKDGAQYAFYYDKTIAGFEAYSAGKAKTITGVATPNPSTIVFTLTRPTGDFLYRMALPATAPIPPEIGRCFDGQPGKYGKDIVSTGPYMLQGADKVNASSCSTLKAMSGWDAVSNLTLVRNPEYDAKTDSPAARQNLPDRFVFTVDANASDIVDKVAAGQLDDEYEALPPQTLEQYSTDPAKRKYLHVNPSDGVAYITMNLTQPPFDDIHVRKAMNWIIDKAAIRQVAGGPLIGKIAGHIIPDGVFDNQLADYDPYHTPGEHGSLAEAKAAMLGSKYDPRGNGMCSAAACHDVLLLNDAASVWQHVLPIVVQDAKEIGITFHVSTIAGAFPTLQTTSKNIAIAIFTGAVKDYADPLTFFNPLLDGQSIIPQGNTNFSLVGLKPSQAKALGVTGTITGVPSSDAGIAHCGTLIGPARLACYEGLDKTVMTKAVPWVPEVFFNNTHLTGPRVTQWEYDQFSAFTALAHVAVS